MFKVDEFTFKARYMPVIVAGLPCVIYSIILLAVTEEYVKSTLVIFILNVTLYFLGNISRDCGKKLEERIFSVALPTTILLSYSDKTIDEFTKKRYHQFLEKNVNGLSLPDSLDEEIKDIKSRDRYSSGINWLRKRANGDIKKYHLVHKELIKYNFSRNLVGIKPYLLFIYIVILFWEYFNTTEFSIKILLSKPYPDYIGFWIFLVSFFLIVFYTKNNVKSNAIAYAKALIETCED